MSLIRNIPLSGTWAGLTVGSPVIQTDAGIFTPGQVPAGVTGHMDWVQDPAHVRGVVLKSTVTGFSFPTPGNPDGANGNRSEIYTPPEPVSAGNPVDRWYSWRCLIDSDWTGAVGRQFCIFQIHDTPGGGAQPRWPNAKILADDTWLTCTLPAAVLPAQSASYRYEGCAKIKRGRWMHFVFHAKWSMETSTSVTELFVDGVPILKEYGRANAYADTVGPYFKLGVYNTQKHTGDPTSAYFSGIEHYDGAGDSYGSIVGATNARSMSGLW